MVDFNTWGLWFVNSRTNVKGKLKDFNIIKANYGMVNSFNFNSSAV